MKKKPKSLGTNLLESGFAEFDGEWQRQKVRFINVFSVVVGLFFVFVANASQDRTSRFIIAFLLIMAMLSFANILVLRLTKNIKLASFLLLLAVSLPGVILITLDDNRLLNLSFLSFASLVSVPLLGKRDGLRVAGFLLVVVFIFSRVQGEWGYTTEETLRSLWGFFTITGILVFFTNILEANQLVLLESNKELRNLNTKLKKKYKELNIAEQDLEKFKLALDNASDHIIITKPDGKIVYVNDGAERLTGYSEADLLAGDISLWSNSKDRARRKKLIKRLKKIKKRFRSEFFNKKKKGQEYITEVYVSPIFNDNKIAYLLFIERDITKSKNMDRVKSEFVSIASHQLKSPLSSMGWHLDLLLDDEYGKLSSSQAEGIIQVKQIRDSMLELVTGLLDLSRMESGELEIQEQRVDLVSITDTVMLDFKGTLKEKNITCVKNNKSILPHVFVDPLLIKQVYINLLSNAIKYSPKGTKVTITLDKYKSKYVRTVISDQGYGIPEKEQENIFKRFYRAKNVKKFDIDGTGLGLYFIKSIVERFGGEISFESEEGQGTTFTFILPVEPVKKDRERKGLVEKHKLSEGNVLVS